MNLSVKEMIAGLSQAAGPSGAEGSAARLALELLSDYTSVRQDRLGSVIAELGNDDAEEHILIDAHIDEIGMVVTYVDDKGFLHVSNTGGTDRRTLAASEVYVFGKKRLSGIVCSTPPHLSGSTTGKKAPEWDKVYIDIGYDAEKARELVPPGSMIVTRARMQKLFGDRITGKALDDRIGAAAPIRMVEMLAPEADTLPCRLTVLLSVREEVGGQGAEAASFAVFPTQAVVVDVSFARQPGVKKEQSGVMGKGPMIGISPILDRGITDTLRDIAVEKGIAYQLEVMSGTTGTNADDIASARDGVRCGLVSIPIRNMHTAVEVADVADIEATARLLAEFVRNGGARRG